MKRSGFSLIELVLAIVIIAISLMSVPMLLSQSSKSSQYSLIQESVMAARTRIGNILTFQWDDNSTAYEKAHPDMIKGVFAMDVENGDGDLNRTAGSILRVGHISSKRRRMHDNEFNASKIGHERVDDFDDIDDFDGAKTTVTATDGVVINGTFDYLDKSKLEIGAIVRFFKNDIDYSKKHLAFNFGIGKGQTEKQSTNIKMIELNVSSAFSDNPFILRAYSCNIGGISKLYSQEK